MQTVGEAFSLYGMGIFPDNNLINYKTMKHLSLIASALAVLGLTACEKGLEDETAVSPTGQVGNSVLQVPVRLADDGTFFRLF